MDYSMNDSYREKIVYSSDEDESEEDDSKNSADELESFASLQSSPSIVEDSILATSVIDQSTVKSCNSFNERATGADESLIVRRKPSKVNRILSDSEDDDSTGKLDEHSFNDTSLITKKIKQKSTAEANSDLSDVEGEDNKSESDEISLNEKPLKTMAPEKFVAKVNRILSDSEDGDSTGKLDEHSFNDMSLNPKPIKENSTAEVVSNLSDVEGEDNRSKSDKLSLNKKSRKAKALETSVSKVNRILSGSEDEDVIDQLDELGFNDSSPKTMATLQKSKVSRVLSDSEDEDDKGKLDNIIDSMSLNTIGTSQKLIAMEKSIAISKNVSPLVTKSSKIYDEVKFHQDLLKLHPRMSENIKYTLSSTIMEEPKESDIEEEVTKSLECITNTDVIEIIDDSDEEVKSSQGFANCKDGFKNIASHKMFQSILVKQEDSLELKPNRQIINMEKNLVKIEFDANKVSPEVYENQKKKVEYCLNQMMKLQAILTRMNTDILPDKGKRLKDNYANACHEHQTQKHFFDKMVATEELRQPPPAPKTWQDLKAGSSGVQPKTFGKQAMATHNLQKALTLDRLQELHGAMETCPTEETMETDPKGLKVELMPHQRHALAWMLWREKMKPAGGILADDMGLGKTLSLISLIMKSNELCKKKFKDEDSDDSDEENNETRYKYKGGTLVICPTSLLSQWDGEIKSRVRSGLLSVELYHGSNRESKAKVIAKYDVVITTYAIIMHGINRSSPLFKIKWERIILDEAHQVRNHKTQTSIGVCQLSAKHRWTLTGTPIHNKEVDLYALLKFLRCSPFDDLTIFKRWATDRNSGGSERLKTVMSSLMLRRTKAQMKEKGVLTCLPERKWEIITVNLEKQEMDVYQRVLIFSKTLFSQFLHQKAEKNEDYKFERASNPTMHPMGSEAAKYGKMYDKLFMMNGGRKIQQHQILVLLLRLRQMCCHPSLITAMLLKEDVNDSIEVEEEKDEDVFNEMNLLDQLNNLNIDDNEVILNQTDGEGVGLAEAARSLMNPAHPVFAKDRRSSKINAVIEVVKNIPTEDKVIIVSQWTSVLNLLGVQLKTENIFFDQLDGTIQVHKRGVIVNNFNNPKSPVRVLLLSLTAGGVGLNLVGANHLLLFDLHWNPQLEMQAQDRIYRVGQTKQVNIYKFMAADTIEERIKKLQDDKKNIAESLLTGAKTSQNKLTLNDLKMLFDM